MSDIIGWPSKMIEKWSPHLANYNKLTLNEDSMKKMGERSNTHKFNSKKNRKSVAENCKEQEEFWYILIYATIRTK